MNLTCESTRPLVGIYMDGELSVAQGASVREHLLGCPGCREIAKEGQLLQHWFSACREQAPSAASLIPVGFAAHVTRRAFAGDQGLAEVVSGEGTVTHERGEGRVLTFVLRLTAVAAAALFVFSLAIQQRTLPASGDLRADSLIEPWLEVQAPAPSVPMRTRPPDEGEGGRSAASESLGAGKR